MKRITLLGIPLDVGSVRRGCRMGPDAVRVAGITETLKSLGHDVVDFGDLKIDPAPERQHPNRAVHHLEACTGWIERIQPVAYELCADGQVPVFIGGDHLMAAGTLPGVAQRAHEDDAEQFVLWLDAHSDFHTLDTTKSGNLHGVPAAYFTGCDGFEGYFPPVAAPVKPGNVFMLGLRSVDEPERQMLAEHKVAIADMRAIDEHGVASLLRGFIERVKKAKGRLHISFDVDFLDPAIAPAVGTMVPGGATFREAHLVMEMLHDSRLVTSIDIAELNPFLDHCGQTAVLLTDLVASLFGKRVLDRPTRSP
ncbi:MAG: arginase [Hyphomicrobiales bacterium]|nr:arginase [Hyphomicrobiales bacterium]